MDWIQSHKMLVITLVVLVVGATWYGMQGSAAPAPLITVDEIDTGSPSENVADRELVESLLTLRAITLSGMIFSDPVFKVLQDFGTSIVPEPVGRANPFAPLYGQSAAVETVDVPIPMPMPTPIPSAPRR